MAYTLYFDDSIDAVLPVFSSGDKKLLTELLELLESHFRIEKNPLFYGDALNITVWYLNKVCKQHYQMTFYELLLDRLFLESMVLLSSTDLSAKQIAYELGFRDACYFSNFFRHRSGMTPVNWRKSVK